MQKRRATGGAAVGKLHALVVEDDQDLARLFALALEDAGFSTTVIFAGDAALENLAAAVPDLVVLDLYLPHVSGLDVLQRIRRDSRFAHTRVIVVTAGVRAAETLQEQADLVLVKPLDFVQLRDLAMRLVPEKGDTESD
jgi:DNA-binding response OmpR family regulator